MRSVLKEYRVRILAPEGHPPNEVMDEALQTLVATLEYKGNTKRSALERLIAKRFVDGFASPGEAGFTVEVREVEER